MNPRDPVEDAGRGIDICLFGATGFAGRLTARHLLQRCTETGMVLALAGRNRERLEALRSELLHPRSGTASGKPPSIVIRTADSGDRDSLDRLAAECRVICSTVGPYARYGSPLVAACVKHGTDYLDLTGEVQWIREIIDSHHHEAERSGSRIVPSCGFDSIPSDLGVLAVQNAAISGAGRPARSLELRVEHMEGGFSRGTLESMVTLIKAATWSRRVRRILKDPDSLTPTWRSDRQKKPRPGRYRRESRQERRSSWRDSTGTWCMPFFMEGVNARVVRRSNALLGERYGGDLRYREVLPIGVGLKGFLGAAGARLLLGVLVSLLVFPPTRMLLVRLLFPKQRAGPRIALEGGGGFRLSIYDADQALRVLAIEGDRDPGYGATAIMLGESALLLAETARNSRMVEESDQEQSDRRDQARSVPRQAGVLTPAAALGEPLLERLQAAGVRFQLVAGMGGTT